MIALAVPVWPLLPPLMVVVVSAANTDEGQNRSSTDISDTAGEAGEGLRMLADTTDGGGCDRSSEDCEGEACLLYAAAVASGEAKFCRAILAAE